MDPWRRRRRFFKDMFDPDFGFGIEDFEDSFGKMEEHIARMLNEAMKNAPEGATEGKPYVYGFSMKMGPDGKPHIEEFGDVNRGMQGEGFQDKTREPLTDIIKEDSEVTVIAELPGIEKKDIDLTTKPKQLTIKVDTDKRNYFKSIKLPAEVDTDSAKARYKNGILEVKLKRIKPQESDGKKVKID